MNILDTIPAMYSLLYSSQNWGGGGGGGGGGGLFKNVVAMEWSGLFMLLVK